MRTIILATATLLGMGAASAYANEGGPVANTFFTELPGVVAQVPEQAPSAIAGNQGGAPTAAFIANSSQGTWLFPPTANQGPNS